MLGAFAKAIEQIPDPRFLKVVLTGIVGALLALVVLWSAVGWALGQVAWTELWLIGPMVRALGAFANGIGWISFALGAGGLTWLLFPATAVAVIALFLDDICAAVEKKYYPQRRAVRGESILRTVFNALRFLGVTVLVNLIVLPVYLGLLLCFGSGAFLFLIVNGYLVGREVFELVAARRMPPRPARRLRKVYRGRLLVFGIVAVLMMSVPLLNLIATVLAAAAMVHFYESLPRKAEFEAMDGAE